MKFLQDIITFRVNKFSHTTPPGVFKWFLYTRELSDAVLTEVTSTNGVDILGRPNAASGGIGDEDAGCASANEDEFLEDWRKKTDYGFEKRAVRISHVAASEAGP
jgi:hypothetical protein